jgi:hypothetical protein
MSCEGRGVAQSAQGLDYGFDTHVLGVDFRHRNIIRFSSPPTQTMRLNPTISSQGVKLNTQAHLA